jgi:hypothetical protein
MRAPISAIASASLMSRARDKSSSSESISSRMSKRSTNFTLPLLVHHLSQGNEAAVDLAQRACPLKISMAPISEAWCAGRWHDGAKGSA